VATNPDQAPNHAPLVCARCAVELRPGAGNFYQVTIEAVADPTPPVVAADETATTLRRQIERLISQMHDLSAREALDQVHRRFVIHLCGPCFGEWIENPAG
jgi:hypothetical protein